MTVFVLPCCDAATAEGQPPCWPLSEVFVKQVVEGGLGDVLERRAKAVDYKPPLSSSVHEATHGAAAFAVGAQVGLIERYCCKIHDAGLAVADRVFISLAGPVASLRADHIIFRRPDDQWAPFVRRARCGSRVCDECSAATVILADRPGASDAQVIAALRDGEARAIAFTDNALTWGLIGYAAAELHERGSMTGERLAEILGQ
jgi:hypothetical protein